MEVVIAFVIRTQKWDTSGFVILQECIVRCATNLQDQLVLWVNLRFQLADFLKGDLRLIVE